MNDEKMKSIKDLIVAILLSDCDIKKRSKSERDIIFTLENSHKQYILENYISRNQIDNYIDIQRLEDSRFLVKSNLLIEKILQDWTDEKQRVSYINPQLLNVNVFILLICLFGQRGKKDVHIKTSMTRGAQETVQFFMFEYIGVHFIPSGRHFKIRLLNKLVEKSIVEGRPAYESVEMASLLTESERKSFLTVREKHKEDQYTYAFY
ncbi:hypothetical protein M3603_15155 [Rummeliibacillus stabekisii]|uniref:hypothetical protein n=1 Tax=Rummeliibacillus stabekisii TaxID=241244 RepID=UPI00203BA2A2|nr:hypothetical protein [Rummeliibacillus stabekisii]MCM3317955.1 hypothetical protein [Rummeliibacillus stabekisii]